MVVLDESNNPNLLSSLAGKNDTGSRFKILQHDNTSTPSSNGLRKDKWKWVNPLGVSRTPKE